MYRLSLATALLIVFALTACSPAERAPEPAFDPAPFTGTTTSPETTLRNLDAAIEGQERALRLRPADPIVLVALSDSLQTRSQFRGTFEDLGRLEELGQLAVAEHPDEAWALDLRARAAQAVHRFDAALTDLDAAERLDGRSRDYERTTVWLARGERLDEVLALRLEKAEAYPNFRNLTAVAAALGALGEYERADRYWIDALGYYRDVSPLPIAYVAFQRGVMWSEQAGRSERGEQLYREAVRRFPAYGVANVHLAELEWEGGDAAGAEARLRAVMPLTSDPEPGGLLAEILAERGDAEAATHAGASAARYDELLTLHPLAFLDHGAEFFGGPGADPERALAMSLRNLENRSNARAFEIALGAALALNDTETFCEVARDARDAAPSVPLRELLAQSPCR